MSRSFYCAYASDTQAVAAITCLVTGSLEVRALEVDELVPEEAIFFYTDYRGRFGTGHHLRHVRQDGQDKIGHFVNRNFKIPTCSMEADENPEPVLATEVIALRPIPSGETTTQSDRRKRGIIEAVNLVHFTFTGERINGFRPIRERKRKSYDGGWRSGHMARRNAEVRGSFACAT